MEDPFAFISGLETWATNFAQTSFTFNTPQNLANIRSPYPEYMINLMFGGAQIASFFGGFIISPLYGYYRYRILTPDKITNNSSKVIKAACMLLQGRILLAGLAAAPLLTVASIWFNKYTREDIVDRCYKIRCDEKILVHQRSSLLMGVIGWYCRRFQGAVVGINASLFYTLIYFKFIKERTNPVLLDVLREDQKYLNTEEAEFDKGDLLKFAKRKIEIKQ